MSTPQSAVPSGAGFYSLFDVAPTVFKPEVMKALGNAMATAMIPGDSSIDSGYVYLAQFISHDISRRAPPARPEFVPAAQVVQQRTPELDLDQVYGDGFFDGRIAVDESTGKMLLGTAFGPNNELIPDADLPRGPGLQARVGDDRDDENLLIAQLHLQFLKLHNLLVDGLTNRQPGLTAKQKFDEARRRLVLIYQDVVLYDFLRAVLDPGVWEQVIRRKVRRLWKPVRAEMARMPVEFAVAAFRFAHAMVRPSYAINYRTHAGLPELFEMTGSGKNDFGHRPGLPYTHVVDWKFFFTGLSPVTGKKPRVNKSLRIDPSVDVSTPSGPLAELDLGTGNRSLLPNAQDIVARLQLAHPTLGLRALTRQELNPVVRNRSNQHVALLSLTVEKSRAIDPFALSRKSPLWYYLLCEAYARHGGDRLGPLGSQIVAETLHALTFLGSISLFHTNLSTLDIDIEPTGEEIAGRRHFRMVDLLGAVSPSNNKTETSSNEPQLPPSNAANDKVVRLSHVA